MTQHYTCTITIDSIYRLRTYTQDWKLTVSSHRDNTKCFEQSLTGAEFLTPGRTSAALIVQTI